MTKLSAVYILDPLFKQLKGHHELDFTLTKTPHEISFLGFFSSKACGMDPYLSRKKMETASSH